jgi:beta-N-acetylhexosaminidase
MDLAPVVDVNSNPENPVIGTRSFGSDPDIVRRFGVAMIAELRANGIIATAKHFPGHGDTSLDSHTALPLVPYDRARLDRVELPPFAAAIAAGVDVIMTAHVVLPEIEPTPDLPATLSARVLTGLLRDELGFEGLIASDSLTMGALEGQVGTASAAAGAFQAGADLLMFGDDPGHDPAEHVPAYQRLLALVRDGAISEERLDASVRRILLVKAQRGILDWEPASPPQASASVRTSDHLDVAARIARQSVTLVKNDAQLLPIAGDQRVLLVYPGFETGLPPAFAYPAGGTGSGFGGEITAMPVGIDPNQGEINQVLEAAANADVIIVATADARRHPGQIALVEAVQGMPAVVLALQSPYDLFAFPEQPTYLVTYGDVPASLQAAAEVLFGQLQPRGQLPVALGDLYPEGYGLEGF